MRKSRAKKRILLPDPKFNDVLVTRFVNNLMYDGKKNKSYDVFYEALEIVEKRTPDSNPSAPKKCFKIFRCADELMGRNSVRAWIMPRRID